MKNLLKRLFRKRQFQGNFKTWSDAKNASKGYETDDILKRAIHCRDLVLSGKAKYEQDLRVYHTDPFKPESLSALLWIYKEESKLNVLDFGGSFGTSFYIHNRFLENLYMKWNVVEQEKYVKYAKEHYETGQLKFHYSINECKDINVVYLSGVLAYLEYPYDVVNQLVELKPKYIILDRNHTLDNPDEKTRLTIQVTNKMTIPTSYPCWLFNEKDIINAFNGYEIIANWKEKTNENMNYQGMLLRLK